MRGIIACAALVFSLTGATAWAQSAGLSDPSPAHLPRWRGFNLPDMVSKEWARGPFHEEDFQRIARLGFNFVRLPLDYRLWILGGDWERIDQSAFAPIDQAVRWGVRYGLHVCLNLHRAPGYCVNPPTEPRDLFSDPAAQRTCTKHWAFIAARYRGIPNRSLSFNLLNEPRTADGKAYAKVVSLLCQAIRAEDPGRLIIADALSYGTEPCFELQPLGVAQATRGYQPMALTHYRADWVEGSETWPVPQWPTLPVSVYLYGPEQPELASPLVIDGPFEKPTRLRIRVGQVSSFARLRVRADGKPVLDRAFRPGPGKGEWKTAVYSEEWKIWQNIYDLDVSVRVPAGTRRLEIDAVDGDWMSFSEMGFLAAGASQEKLLRPADSEWGHRQGEIRADLASDAAPFVPAAGASGGETSPAARNLWQRAIAPFQELERRGTGIVVGEFGAYRFTPHDVVLAWMRDCLESWKRAGWGWALWNFRGDFGVLDSRRADVVYEPWEGHLLDREMLDLLQQF